MITTIVIIVIICILPFIFMNGSRKKERKKIVENLKALAKENHCEIAEFDSDSNFAIGWDTPKTFVFFYKKVGNREFKQAVNLKSIQVCKYHKISRNDVINKLELELIPKSKIETAKKLEFFDVDIDMQLSGQLQTIEKWDQQIGGQLRKLVL